MEIAAVGNEASDSFAALADPVRLRILDRLRASDATVSDLAADLGVAMPSVSKHLNVLQRAGFVVRHAEAQRRRCSLDPEGFSRLAEWTRHYELMWAGRLSRLEAVLGDGERDQ
ncbi:MAG: metalloregulator ArsR/SmtB family transcription factor [Dehalococcoidia bacterium]|nr:metalloregulator ArsR/SmtB family transcription factor [Dehalococcoidia bacterium]